MKTYLSHSIRGTQGMNCTPEQQRENCDAAIRLATMIRASCPGLDLYVPGEHEEFVQKAFEMAELNLPQILKIDCGILDTCDNIIIYVPEGDELQGGRLVEHDHAINECMTVGLVKDAKDAIDWLTEIYNYDIHHGVEPKNR